MFSTDGDKGRPGERNKKKKKKTREEVKREGYCGFWPSRCVTNIKGRFEFLAVVPKPLL